MYDYRDEPPVDAYEIDLLPNDRDELDDSDRASVSDDDDDTSTTSDDDDRPSAAIAPTFEQRQPGESLQAYGARVLIHLLADRPFYLCDDDALKTADHCAIWAVAHSDISPIAAQNISNIRHRIAQQLQQRERERQLTTSASTTSDRPSDDDSSSSGGSHDRLRPRPAPIAPAAAADRTPVVRF